MPEEALTRSTIAFKSAPTGSFSACTEST
ncbi:hypothetical protein DSM3645_03783 [Blastopirellula marina DSM 3645]|uniref:Uncharacterized protein n=1 Tax=Blastopirellula marina DSM 3645 TaxID=314230 RepID=A3ZW68_9BACT|nr:hypothetical protein DSM3645_03783 [Blastopirellula marina DSM 3645]